MELYPDVVAGKPADECADESVDVFATGWTDDAESLYDHQMGCRSVASNGAVFEKLIVLNKWAEPALAHGRLRKQHGEVATPLLPLTPTLALAVFAKSVGLAVAGITTDRVVSSKPFVVKKDAV